MRLKLDENFGTRTLSIFREFGHDVHTTGELAGAHDTTIFDACLAEQRCLITLDVGFANVLRFPPHQSAGIAVVRLGKGASPEQLATLVRGLLLALQTRPIAGRLWVVESGRIRVHARTDESD